MRVTVFGGTGFLGRHIVSSLTAGGAVVRVAARQTSEARATIARPSHIEGVRADVRDEASVATAVAGADTVVNAVGLYMERGTATFDAIHVAGAGRVAEQATRAGARRLIHLSGIGARNDSPSTYVRSRARGEAAVRAASPDSVVLRPSALFGPHDAFLSTLVRMVRLSPVLPLFGDGRTRLQPVHVKDVAEAVARAALREDPPAPLYELGGPEVFTYRALLELIADRLGRSPFLVPVPFALWDLGARALAPLPGPPLTRDQVALMRDDNVAAPDLPGLRALGVRAQAIELVLDDLL